MNRWTMVLAALVLIMMVAMGCSGGGQTPVTPTADPGITGAVSTTGQSQMHLWGYYDCYIDLENMTVEAVENRNALFAANVVQFVNGNPANLSFAIKGTPVGTGYIDVDIDVSITHPFPGMTMYNGYDVRGIFVGDGSGSLSYNSDLDYGVLGTDQVMLLKPSGTTGDPDGYTRWYNRKEFTTPGICGYTPGIFASKNFAGTATLCPYKYFADGLSATEDVWEFLAGSDDNGVFSAGKKNTRNYYLRFPNTKGVVYGYAIVANWIDETTHPANAAEAIACDVTVTDNIYYVDDTDFGGDLIVDLSLWAWETQPDAIFIESNMLSDVYAFDATDMTPTGGGATFSTYHVEIPTDIVESTEGNEFWVIAENSDLDYKNTFGIPNSAGSDALAACFRYDVFVANEPYNADPICDMECVTPMPHVGQGHIEFDASLSSDPDGDPITFSWDFDGDDVFGDDYDEGTDANPIKYYTEDYVGPVCVQVSDGLGGMSECCVDIDVTYFFPTSYPCAGVSPVAYDSQYECSASASTIPNADDGYVQVPIGFTFSYGTNNYTQVYFNRNGTLSFDTGFYCCTPYCTTTSPTQHIACIADDLNSGCSGSAFLKYETRTIGGVNAFIAEWENVPSYYCSGTNTGQIVLWDTPQSQYDKFYIQIYLHYDSYNNLFYRLNGIPCCMYTSGVPNNSRWEINGQ